MAKPEARHIAIDGSYWFWSRGIPAALATSLVMALTTYFTCSVVAVLLP